MTVAERGKLSMAEIDVRGLDDHSRELFDAARTDADAREELVRIYYPLVEYLARRFSGRGEPIEDLVQVASIALLKAIDRFDLEREVKFSTYATPTIIGELKRHFRDKGWAVRVPRRLQEMGLQVRAVVSEAYQELGRSPTVAEISARSGLGEEDVIEAMDTVHAYSVDSLDTASDEEESRPIDRLATTEEQFELLEGWAIVAPHLRELPQRERKVLYYRFGDQLTQSEIADKLGISQMHVSRILSRTLKALREQAEKG